MQSPEMLPKLIKINSKLPLKTSTTLPSETTSLDNLSMELEKTQVQLKNLTSEISTTNIIKLKMQQLVLLEMLIMNKLVLTSQRLSVDSQLNPNNNLELLILLILLLQPYSSETTKCIISILELPSKPQVLMTLSISPSDSFKMFWEITEPINLLELT